MDYEVLYKKYDEYRLKFNEVFPSMEYDMEPVDAIKFMDKCINSNKTAQTLRPRLKDVNY